MNIKKILLFSLIPFTLVLNSQASPFLTDGRFITPATIDLTTKVSNTLPTTNGGSGINAYNVGDTLYSGSTNTLSKLSGNITTTPKMLMQTGNGTISNAPTWTQPTLNNILAPISTFDFGTQNITGVNNIKTLSTNIAGIGGVLKSSSTIPTTLVSTGLSSPQGVCADSAGNLYIADTGNNAIKKRDASGTVTTLISGLSSPNSIIIDSAGNLYFTDVSTLKKRDTSGTVTTLISSLSSPLGIIIDSLGNLYVGSNTTIKKYDTTATITTFASGFSAIYGVGIDSSNNIYALDYNNSQIKKYNNAGTLITTLNASGNAGNMYLGGVRSIAVDSSGSIYMIEVVYGNWIKKTDINNNGMYFSNPNLGGASGICISPDGKTMYIADTTNNSIKSIDLQGTIKGGASFNDLVPPTFDLNFANRNLGTIGNLTAQNLISTGLVQGQYLYAKALSVSGISTKTANYTLNPGNVFEFGIIGDTTTASFTITLPSAANTGLMYLIKKKVAINTLTIATVNAQLIDGATTQVLTAQYSSLLIIGDGTSWNIISRI